MPAIEVAQAQQGVDGTEVLRQPQRDVVLPPGFANSSAERSLAANDVNVLDPAFLQTARGTAVNTTA